MNPYLCSWSLGSLLLLSLFVLGCGSDEVQLGGAVTFDGQSIPKGEVFFMPTGPGLRQATAKIIDGHYEMLHKEALVPGKYKVRVTAFRPVENSPPRQAPAKDELDPSAEVFPLLEQYLPEKYNVKTTLELEVVAGQFAYDFDLTND